MRRSLLLLVVLFGALCVTPYEASAKPPASWTAYRIARGEAADAPPEEKVRIWSEYLEKFPDSPYREQAIIELEAATEELWSSGDGSPGPIQTYRGGEEPDLSSELEEAGDVLSG